MKAFNKDIVRSIRHSLGRFVAIAAIVALGCGFYAGLRMTAPDMNWRPMPTTTAPISWTFASSLPWGSRMRTSRPCAMHTRRLGRGGGLFRRCAGHPERRAVRDARALAVALGGDGGETDAGALSSDDANYLNRLDLVEGRWPTSANECVIFNDRVMSGPPRWGTR